jgi:hypothetical protein
MVILRIFCWPMNMEGVSIWVSSISSFFTSL